MGNNIFRCTNDEDILVGLDDCAACKMRCLPMPVIRMIAAEIRKDHPYHNKPGTYSVTELIGCLRAAALGRLGAITQETPPRLLGRTLGTILHRELEQYAGDGQAEIQVGAGIICGTIDIIDDDIIADYKFTSRPPKRPKAEHVKQLRAYRALSEASDRPGEIWYLALNGAARHIVDNDPDKDTEILSWLQQRAKELHAAIESRNIDALPKEGKDRHYGPTMTLCDYCPVRVECEGGGDAVPF